MLMYVLLLVTSVACVSARVLPTDELERYMDDLLSKCQTELPRRRPLPDHDYYFSADMKEASAMLKLKTSNTVLIGPRRLERIGDIRGIEESSGAALVRGTLSLGTVEVLFTNLEVNVFGLKYNGSVSMSVEDARVHFTLEVHRDALVRCYPIVTLSNLEGDFAVSVGSSEVETFAYRMVERFIGKLGYPFSTIQYFVFPDVTTQIERTLQHAAKRLSC